MLITLIAVAVGLICFTLGVLIGLVTAYLYIESFVQITGIGQGPDAYLEDDELEDDAAPVQPAVE